jgi:peptidoglycan/LPS O-acetylase OafA/YrhL
MKTLPAGTDLLAAHLGSRDNSLDLLRLISASLVILGHSYPIVGYGVDPMLKWNGVQFSGGFALHVFFFLSGLLVTHSFLKRPEIGHWLASRALRIFPGLFACLVLTTVVLGPLSTVLTPKQYFTGHETWDYLFGNLLLLRTRYLLPGVFAHNVEQAVNGPLWSLYIEVRLYLLTGVLLWVFRRLRREWLTLAILGIALVGLASPKWIFVFGENENHSVCSALFLLGALCALWSDRVVISGLWLVVLFLAANKYIYTVAFAPLFLFFTCYFVLCFGYSRWLSRVRLPGDYSYGLYIYGWPVQQLIAEHFPHWSPLQNAGGAMAGAATLAVLSWHFVEKRSLEQKQRFSKALAQHWKAVFMILGVGATILIGLSYPMSRPVEGLGSIVAFGPDKVFAGERFNVQDGLSAMWVRLSSPVSPQSCVVFQGQKLHSVVSGSLVTALVPDDLLKKPGEVEIYVLDESYLPPKRTAVSKLTIVRRVP